MKLLVTGGAGFIGSALIRHLIRDTDWEVVNLDKLTYAGNLESLESVEDDPRYRFERVCICDADAMRKVFARHQPDGVIHLAAESHVDRSIDGPADFIQTNIVGAYILLEAAREYWNGLPAERRPRFRFHHVSTDEVFGSLGPVGRFTETTAYQPNSPYSASKAASDHLARAWHHTFGLPVVTTNCSNNYGPYQFPEKLIPLMILNAVENKPLPVYGTGDNIRDWLYVDDHVRGLTTVFQRGRLGETYNLGGNNEQTNLSVVETLCDLVDELCPDPDGGRRRDLITFVPDRPGHDKRYAIDTAKVAAELGWKPGETFATGLRKTIQWYLEHQTGWCRRVHDGSYQRTRLGLG